MEFKLEKEVEQEHHHCPAHVAMKISKLVLKAAIVAGIFCLSHEVHKVHKAIEKHRK